MAGKTKKREAKLAGYVRRGSGPYYVKLSEDGSDHEHDRFYASSFTEELWFEAMRWMRRAKKAERALRAQDAD